MTEPFDGMEVREYQPGDREAVVALWEACNLTRPWNDPDEDIHRAIGGPSSTVLVGTRGVRIVASAMVGHDGHRGWVYYVSVAPDRQGKGDGRAIMHAAERWLADKGAVKVMLMIREGNGAVQGFYETLGYEVEPRISMARWLER